METLALAIGRSAATIQGYELDRARPPLCAALTIADTLGVDVRDLMEPAESGAATATGAR